MNRPSAFLDIVGLLGPFEGSGHDFPETHRGVDDPGADGGAVGGGGVGRVLKGRAGEELAGGLGSGRSDLQEKGRGIGIKVQAVLRNITSF